ncbi:VWA domain-containing protein, partial [Myxococcota bacterium]|nr:VWA domain-containing protein [Myxococcota bacterium]
MLSLTLVLGLAVAQTPDDLDVFRTDPKANILFLLDSSCSMGPSFGLLPTGCTWFAANYNGGNTNLSKQQMMKAALIGCTSADDGILDRWASKLNVSIHHFGGTVARLAPFNSTLSALETAVRGVPATGGTPMTSGLRSAGAYFRTAFTDATHPSCRKDYVVLMSDGEPNGGSATFNYDCGSPVETLAVSANEPWWGARYLYRRPNAPITPRDLLCTVTGVQPIRTYTVGFEALDTFDESNLQNIASYGDGSYFHATDVSELTRSFEGILSNIISRSHVDYSSPTTQTTGLFADNYAYSAYFRPIAGPWIGTLKKFCIEPRRTSTGLYDTSQTNCLYTSADGTTLFTNPAPQDLFTFIASANADRGGTGEVLFSVLGAGPNGAPVAPYWSHRNIVTWRDGTGWVPVDPAHLSRADTWANGCEHFRLINHLHGYSFDADCNTGAPVQVRDWPMGAPIHANPVLLKYGPCHDASDAAVPGVCFVAQATNDGMLHLFDAATGRETSAIVPAELWALGRVAKNRLERIMDQPTATVVQRYFVDGALRLFHDDLDGDTIIDDGEPARLVFGLGRGGSAYHQLDVGRLDDGVVTTDENPLYPLVATRGTALEELRETWHAPYVGRAVV